MNIKKMTTCAVIAAAYAALSLLLAPISYGNVQIRVSEALTILPLFTPAAIPGLFIGCLLGNVVGGALLPDIIFGSLATLIGAVFTWLLRSRRPVIGTLPPIISNVVIVPLVLRIAYGVNLPLPFLMLTVGVGEVISCTILGLIVYYALNRYRNTLFPRAAAM